MKKKLAEECADKTVTEPIETSEIDPKAVVSKPSEALSKTLIPIIKSQLQDPDAAKKQIQYSQ